MFLVVGDGPIDPAGLGLHQYVERVQCSGNII